MWFGLEGSHVVCYDESGATIGDYAELQVALDIEVEARVAAEQRVQALEAELRRLRGEA